jgi:hypothetical protein
VSGSGGGVFSGLFLESAGFDFWLRVLGAILAVEEGVLAIFEKRVFVRYRAAYLVKIFGQLVASSEAANLVIPVKVEGQIVQRAQALRISCGELTSIVHSSKYPSHF